MTISDSTISENVVYFGNDGAGAGIFNVGAMQITNGTISGNYFAAMFCSPGAGIFNMGSLDVRFSTITKNGTECSGDYGSGIHNDGAGSVELYNTIVAGNVNGPEVYGSYRGRANLIGGNPMLEPLQSNGGHTQTHAVLPGSPALDAGDNTDAPEFDQRGPGFRRIVNGTIDIGAFEVQTTGAPGSNDMAALITMSGSATIARTESPI